MKFAKLFLISLLPTIIFCAMYLLYLKFFFDFFSEVELHKRWGWFSIAIFQVCLEINLLISKNKDIAAVFKNRVFFSSIFGVIVFELFSANISFVGYFLSVPVYENQFIHCYIMLALSFYLAKYLAKSFFDVNAQEPSISDGPPEGVGGVKLVKLCLISLLPAFIFCVMYLLYLKFLFDFFSSIESYKLWGWISIAIFQVCLAIKLTSHIVS